MQYKGYIGYVNYDESAKIFFGRVLSIDDVVTKRQKLVMRVLLDENLPRKLKWHFDEGVEVVTVRERGYCCAYNRNT